MTTTRGPLLTPNQITVSRFILTFPLFIGWFLTPDELIRSLICVGFILVFFADAWDGLVARKYNMSSLFGVYFDPIVDHISYFAMCLMLIEAGYLSLWFLFVFITRDLLVVFLKQYAAAEKVVISASFLAKAKADIISVPLACVYLMVVVGETAQIMILIGLAAYLFSLKFIFNSSREHMLTMRFSVLILAVVFFLRPEGIDLARYYELVYIALALIMCVGSGILYFWSSRELLLANKAARP